MSDVLTTAGVPPKILCSTQLAGTGAATVYTVPALRATVVKHGVVCNTGGVIVNVTLSIVPSGGTADGTHRVLSAVPVAAGDSFPLGPYIAGACLGPGDFISAQASVAAVLDIVITGIESA